jgi:uroporphyrinogen-III decarboxylase
MVAFDWDYVPLINCGGHTDLLHPLPFQIIEDNEEYCIRTDKFGMKEKLCKKSASVFHPLEFPVKNMDDWLRIKPQYEYSLERINWNQLAAVKKLQSEGALVTALIPGGFDLPRVLMGEEALCLAYYDEPDMIKDIIDTITDTALKVLDQISDRLTIDNLGVHEDMAGKSGSLIGPNLILQYIKPYYRKIWDMLSSKGTRIFSQDSDGNMNSVIDAFLECGVNLMYPMEPAAGMDIVELRKKYGRKLAFKGGIDKHVLKQDKEFIRKELEYKMQPLMQEGGMVFGIDHRIPNGTPLENYRYYVNTGREILGLPPRDTSKKGWQRMAF